MLISILSTLSTIALAVPIEYQVNAREECRQAVAGSYVQAYDEHERAIEYVETVSLQVKALKAASGKANREAKDAAALMSGKPYDVDIASKNDAAASSARAIEQQLAEYQQLAAKAEKDLAPTKERERALREQLLKVFVIEKVKDPPRGYPFRVKYRTACPKFRALCPLPEQQQEDLAGFKIDGALPESCRKYLGQSKIR